MPVKVKNKDGEDQELLEGECTALGKRKITEATCVKYGYIVAYDKYGNKVQVSQYKDPKGGTWQAQHIRPPGKKFYWIGQQPTYFYGQWLWPGANRRVVITEGQLDALSAFQAMGCTWPVVSVPGGTGSVAKTFAAQQEWLEQQEQIILCFDNDEAGQKALKQALELCPVGKAYIATLPLKDASDMLQAGREEELRKALLFEAQKHRPDGMLIDKEIEPAMLTTHGWGLPWPWESMTKLTYGRHAGSIYVFGAGPGVGKSDFLCQMIYEDVKAGRNVGAFFLEEHPAKIMDKLISKHASKVLFRPDQATEEERRQATESYRALPGTAYIYDSTKSELTWDAIKPRVKYLANAEQCKVFVIDNLTVLLDGDKTDSQLHDVMKDIAAVTKELQIVVCLVSHLRTPSNNAKPHEEGGQVHQNQLYGSRAIAQYCHLAFGLERNTQAEDEDERNTLLVRCVKSREYGHANGVVLSMRYDPSSGLITDGYIPKPPEVDIEGLDI